VSVHGDVEKLSYLAEVLPTWQGIGIIYSATKKDAESVAAFLESQGLNTAYYHADRDNSTRQEVEQKLMANQYKVVCSTNALGMGIDKPDVRFVVHYHFPASPIHYYQEMGRAGRDGNIARCVLLYDSDDFAIQESFIKNAKPESKHYETILSLFRASLQALTEWDLMRMTGLAQKYIRTIVSDLEDQGFVEHGPKNRGNIARNRIGQIDFAAYDIVREEKLQELSDIQNYAHYTGCYMEYLTRYLGDQPGYCCGVCAHCQPENFPSIQPPKRMHAMVEAFLDENLPRIEKPDIKSPVHETGWAMAYYGTGRIGRLVRASKYEGAGPFGEELVTRAIGVIRLRYPIGDIDGIVGVPPTKSEGLVAQFAQQIAVLLNIAYLPVVEKIRVTRAQKDCTNWLQKQENVKGAFDVQSPELVAGRTLLLIDDIYDSGRTLREVGRVLMLAGARGVHPFTITQTRHSDDQ
jgi:ATP-dependent DNA helicase RecQ